MKDIFIVQNANDEGCVAVGSYNARVPLEGTPYRYNPTATNFQVHSLRSCASPSKTLTASVPSPVQTLARGGRTWKLTPLP